MKHIGKLLDMPYIKVYEVATFYTMYNLTPRTLPLWYLLLFLLGLGQSKVDKSEKEILKG